jgi:hypothetical protein
MPQDRAKKIKIQLLLTDFSLQFFDPALGLRRIGDVDRGQARLDLRRVNPRWAANTAQRLNAAGLKLVAPVI